MSRLKNLSYVLERTSDAPPDFCLALLDRARAHRRTDVRRAATPSPEGEGDSAPAANGAARMMGAVTATRSGSAASSARSCRITHRDDPRVGR